MYVSATDNSIFLDWVEIGNVSPAGEDDYNFTYRLQESEETVWQGHYILNFTVAFIWTMNYNRCID